MVLARKPSLGKILKILGSSITQQREIFVCLNLGYKLGVRSSSAGGDLRCGRPAITSLIGADAPTCSIHIANYSTDASATEGDIVCLLVAKFA
jgi:hypothetical protein